MKTIKRAVICFCALLLLCGCSKKENEPMKPEKQQTVTFQNEVRDADVWILPQTQENLKTTLWGTPSAADVKTGESRSVALDVVQRGERYLLRMIDADKFYYSANDIALEENWKLTVKGDDLYSVTLEVTDASGALQNTYALFAARL